MRIMGIDLGEKRIGIAVTDKSNRISLPVTTIENNPEVKEKILNLIKEYGVGKIIVGVPYNLKGEKGFQAKQVTDFVDSNFGNLKIPVILMDERFTTKIAVKIMNRKSLSGSANKQAKKAKTGDRDKIAASLILSDYLERLQNAKE